MNREVHVRFWESPEVKVLRPTRQSHRVNVCDRDVRMTLNRVGPPQQGYASAMTNAITTNGDQYDLFLMTGELV